MILGILNKYWLKLTKQYDKKYPWDAPKNNDPVRYCEVFKHKGCSHVDGFLCDFPICNVLQDYRTELERSYKLKKIIYVTKSNTSI